MVTGPIEDKRRYRQYKARTQRLPATYHTAIDALQRYLRFFRPSDKADSLLATLEDLADLFEQSAANGTPLREVVGGTRWSSPRRCLRTTRRVSGSAGSGNG
ncbi:DUF1048 domain-containing protein [Nonomuraea africana]|uniref:DNA-binding ferritin-like protein (Dps family) n=1 Tax=Nonomuraea africana TaxID=46171 RepID=A0ABR9KJP5_9ACTN|nr:DUF1048 domain-containing protein [Nonomuraea africana]MBE1562035.1 DNA-binding ferritin-like protein (Dps family) [Nonomuraea africana]